MNFVFHILKIKIYNDDRTPCPPQAGVVAKNSILTILNNLGHTPWFVSHEPTSVKLFPQIFQKAKTAWILIYGIKTRIIVFF
jgi:hypothetical protein